MKKFDFAIGNPAYNEDFANSGENGNFAKPIYNHFMDEAYKIADRVEMIHPARFLFNAGSTPKAWNEKMLNDPHFKVLHYEEDASKIFSNTLIKGGIAITYHDNNVKFGAIETFTPYPEVNAIMKKVIQQNGFLSLSSIMDNQTKFDLNALYKEHPEYKKVIGSDGKDKRFRNNIFDKIPLFTDNATDASLKVLGVVSNKRTYKYIPLKYVEKDTENLNKWKTLVVRVNGTGVLGEVLSKPVILGPQEGYTQTFIGIGAFKTRTEAENCLCYIKTKFVRTLLSVLKITQDNSIETWKYVPLQDFTASSDIDWSKPVAEVDRQLYKKYGLSEEEINFIETHVQEMK